MKGLYLISLLALAMSGFTIFTSISAPTRPKESTFSMQNYHSRMSYSVSVQDSIMAGIKGNVDSAHERAKRIILATKKLKERDKRRKRTLVRTSPKIEMPTARFTNIKN